MDATTTARKDFKLGSYKDNPRNLCCYYPDITLQKLLSKRCGHQGVNGTLANIRTKFWIPKGRHMVWTHICECAICKRWNGKFYPESPPLPQSRIEPCRAFAHIGIDLAGPFQYLRQGLRRTETMGTPGDVHGYPCSAPRSCKQSPLRSSTL